MLQPIKNDLKLTRRDRSAFKRDPEANLSELTAKPGAFEQTWVIDGGKSA